jgi:hypothetical protein
MSDDEIIAVVQAHKAGQKIQSVYHGNHDWKDCADNDPSWNFPTYDYRVKQEQKRLWLQYCGNGMWQEKFEGQGTHFIEENK